MLESILQLLNSPDAAQVRQGLFLAEELSDGDLAALLEGARLTPSFDSGFVGPLLRDLDPGARLQRYTRHKSEVALTLLALQARRDPQRAGDLARRLSDGIFADLAYFYRARRAADPMLDALRALGEIAPPARVGLQGALLTEIPAWIPLDRLRSLDVSDTPIAELPPVPLRRALVARSALERPPAGVAELVVDGGQWLRWQGALDEIEDLTIEECPPDIDAEALARLTRLRSLALHWADPIAHLPDLLRGLAALTRLEELAISAPQLAVPPTPPPSLRALRVPEEDIPALPPAWRALAAPLAEREVWLLGSGGKVIDAIQILILLRGLGLKAAKDLVMAAPVRVLPRCDRPQAEAALRWLRKIGADAVLR